MSERKEKFTPGPWRVEDRRKAALKNIRIVTADPNPHQVAEVSDVHQRDPLGGYRAETHCELADAIDSLGLANAHLIAAAPELYEALNAIVHHSVSGIHMNNLYAKCLDALAKARGEA